MNHCMKVHISKITVMKKIGENSVFIFVSPRWTEAWQWLNQSLALHLHHNPSFSLIGFARLQHVKSRNFCEDNTGGSSKHMRSLSSPVLSPSNSGHLTCLMLGHSSPLFSWLWVQTQSCVFAEAEQILLRNHSMGSAHILLDMQTSHWIPSETCAVVVEFTQYHRETGLFVPVSILLENTQSGRILSTISIHSFHIPASSSGLDLSIALTALLLLAALCLLINALRTMVREGGQYLRHAGHLLQLLLALLALATALLRLYFLSTATACLSRHRSQLSSFTTFSTSALLARTSTQLAAVLLNLLVLQMVGVVRFVRRWVVLGRVLWQACSEICGVALGFVLLLLLFVHTGSMLFSASVEGFSTWERASRSLLGVLRGRAVLRHLCQQHPALGPLYCLFVFGLGLWGLGRLSGAVLVHTYRTLQAEMYRPSMETQGYEMVEFLIKRLKMWMRLSKTKEFRHRVKFEGMEPPPSRSSQCSHVSIQSVPSSPAGPCLHSSPSSLSSETSTISDNQELQQYLDLLLPSVDSLLAGFSRINQLTDEMLNIEVQLQKVQGRNKQKEPPLQTAPQPDLTPRPPHLDQPGLKARPSSHHEMSGAPPRRRAAHSESSILGTPTHSSISVRRQAQQSPQPMDLERQGFPRRRGWHSGSCHSADTAQRSPTAHNPGALPPRPCSEEGEGSRAREGMPVKRTAWHLVVSETDT